jgi:subtilase family serine protease
MKNQTSCVSTCFSVERLESRRLLSAAPTGLTPQQVKQAYGFADAYLVRKHVQYPADGSGQTIAIIDAFNAPTVKHDLRVFDRQFGLSDYVNSKKHIMALRVAIPDGLPRDDSGWAVETSLDVQWAHAIAPKARIMLVEARSDSLNDLLSALDWARHVAGVSVISMSWGSQEFPYETSLDQYLTTPPGHLGGEGAPGGIAFFTAAGDAGAGTSWPAASPNAVAVGGTTLNVSASGNYLSESAWNGSGGGASFIEHTAAPDVAYDADPATGFSIYDSTPDSGKSGWQTVGGTSAGAPQWAALMAITDEDRAIHREPSFDEQGALNAIYSMPAGDFHDITTGSNGGFVATIGKDLVTGLGTPFADKLIGQMTFV